MERRRAASRDRFEMKLRPIADMARKAIVGIMRVEPGHHPVARDLGDDRGGGDRQARGVALDDRARRRSKGPCGQSRPSISAKAGRSDKALTARAIAASVAPRMLSASISSALAKASETLRRLAQDDLEQLLAFRRRAALWNRRRPRGRSAGSRITAATATGPASGPRPTSSTPAICPAPSRNRSAFDLDNCGLPMRSQPSGPLPSRARSKEATSSSNSMKAVAP